MQPCLQSPPLTLSVIENRDTRALRLLGRAVPDLLQDLPLGKIRNFGGKLGLELQAMGCSTAGQARRAQHIACRPARDGSAWPSMLPRAGVG